MNLPGLQPHHTRASLGSRSRLYTEKYAPTVSDFIETEQGLWLLPASIAERDRAAGEIALGALVVLQQGHDMPRSFVDKTAQASRLLGRTCITDTGCMVDGLRGNQQAPEWALRLGEWDWGSPSFDEPEDMPHLNVCGNEGCYNSRHYDIEFGRPTLRERKVELDLRNFVTEPNGSIKTIWGDRLPSVEDSLTYFIAFQRKNYPFVPYEKSRLSATSVSQIRFRPETGCWEAWQYYCKPEDNLNWQFDGYGRLYQKYRVTDVDPETGEVYHSQRRGHWMAHRVVWNATGRRLQKDRVLNHKCSYRRCCNPLHLEQVTQTRNNQHGREAQRAKRTLESGDVVYLRPAQRIELQRDALELYHKLAA